MENTNNDPTVSKSKIKDVEEKNEPSIKESMIRDLVVKVPRTVVVRYSFDEDMFKVTNRKILPSLSPPIGGNRTATESMVILSQMLRYILPSVVGADPKSTSVNWDAVVRNYFDSMHIHVPDAGKELEIGWQYSIDDEDREKFITPLAKKYNLKDSKDLADFVEGDRRGIKNVEIEDRYKYGKPLNPEHLIEYMYCQRHKLVANNPEDAVGKSKNIRYYIFDPKEFELKERRVSEVKTEAMSAFIKLLTDKSRKDLVLLSLVGSLDGFKDDAAKDIYLQNAVQSTPEQFVSIVGDKHLEQKALINLLISKGIFQKTAGGVIYETADSSNVIGNNMSEAIAYISNVKNTDKVNIFKHSLKTL